MSVQERNFNTFAVGDNPAQLADNLLVDMATTLEYPLSADPAETDLKGFITHIGPDKWLQKNIEVVQERLDTRGDATAIAADWVDRSGILLPMSRSFKYPELATPSDVDVAFITGGVARWMLRRADTLISHVENGNQVGRVFLPVNGREMKETEHDLVKDFAAREGHLPRERDFAATYITEMLAAKGIAAHMFEVGSESGTEIMAEFAQSDAVKQGSTLAVANAPAAVQTAGQFRAAARVQNPGYDHAGDQLYVMADGIQVARNGEGPATHQNALAALGQITRNALYLHRSN